MMELWRISPCSSWREAAHRPQAARWPTRGPDVLYASTSDALALVEALAHLDEHPVGHHFLRLRIADASVATVSRESLPSEWARSQSITRRIGDAWPRSQDTVLFCVPSMHCIDGMNVLVNPSHADFPGLSVIDRARSASTPGCAVGRTQANASQADASHLPPCAALLATIDAVSRTEAATGAFHAGRLP